MKLWQVLALCGASATGVRASWGQAAVQAVDPEPATRRSEANVPPASPWYGWQILLADAAIAAGTVAFAPSSRLDGAFLAAEVGYLHVGPVIHLGHGEHRKAAASFMLRAIPLLVFNLEANEPPHHNDPLGDLVAGIAGATLIDAALLAWQADGPRLAHLYVTAGLQATIFRQILAGPSLGLGYRHEIGNLLLDGSINVRRLEDRWQRNGSLKFLAIGYLDHVTGRSFYAGGGASYGATAYGREGIAQGFRGEGVQAELVAGLELLRRTSLRSFVQLQTTLPLYWVTPPGPTTSMGYAFTTALSVGFGV